MKRDFLTKELGLSKEVTDKIMAQYGESVNSLKTENESLKGEIEANAGVLARMNELEIQRAELEESVGKLSEELKETKINGALSTSLVAAGAKNLKAVGALIDKSKITFEDGEVQGLSEQIDVIKNECEYLFYTDNQSSGMRHTSSQNFKDAFTSYARAGAKLNQ